MLCIPLKGEAGMVQVAWGPRWTPTGLSTISAPLLRGWNSPYTTKVPKTLTHSYYVYVSWLPWDILSVCVHMWTLELKMTEIYGLKMEPPDSTSLADWGALAIIRLSLPPQGWHYRCAVPCLTLYPGTRDPNSIPHAYPESSLLTEPPS